MWVLLLKKKKKAKKRKLKEKQSISNIYMTLTHQNKVRKAKITTQRASERVGTVLKGAKKRKYD